MQIIRAYLSHYGAKEEVVLESRQAGASSNRQNYAEGAEQGVNKQNNMEQYAALVYQSMSFHFARSDIALKGFSTYMKARSTAHYERSEKLMEYQNTRGGRIVLKDIKAPGVEWENHIAAAEDALSLEEN